MHVDQGSIDTVEDSSKSNVATILVDVLSAFLNLWDPIDKSLPATPWINSFMEQDLLVSFGGMLPHPPYSPDQVPSDFHLFAKLKEFLGGKRFFKDEEVKGKVKNCIRVLSKLSNDADLSFSYLDQLALTGHVSPSTLRMFAVYHLKQMIDYRADSFDVMTACQLDEWFKEAVSSLNRELLVFSLLGLRQCCWEGSIRCFPSYPSWFVSLQLKTSTAFTFFFSVLTELVPYEPAIHLKMHVNKVSNGLLTVTGIMQVPAVPANCQPILVDYLTLAKTRLADLNQTTDCIGLFNDYHDFDVEGLESDIARVVTCLRDTNELPKPLLEAFVFRRQYYEKVFLPRLLSIPEREDLARAQVIRKLSSMGKISQSLFGNWVNL
ncbi:hypothetical protein AAG570_000889 [Ranatra chinensis]|uniref:Uncharacterized protein n=1 Tax=Ranatra chinensis TaxID=642074 RepID=A0ABD0ZJM5_9HEMI